MDLTQSDADGNVSTRYEFTPKEREALEYARQNNILVVVAAGNDGGVMSALGQASQEFDNIITVGAAEQINGETSAWKGFDRASYSSYGKGLDIIADSGTLENPVMSTVGDGVGTMTGTSVATAKVTGTASQIWAANPELNYRQVIDILKSTATDLNTPNPDLETGSGLLNMAAAIPMAKATESAEYNPELQVVPITWSGQGQVTPMERAVNYSYQMKADDTLWGIAQRELGSGTRWTEITKDAAGTQPFTSAEAKNFPVGQIVYIPGDDPNPQPENNSQPETPTQPSQDQVKQVALSNFLNAFGNVPSASFSDFLKEMFENFYDNGNEPLNSQAPEQGTDNLSNTSFTPIATQSANTLAGKKIILDPGHGITNTGFDPGAGGNGTTEAKENLHQANLIANHLRQLGAEVKVLDEPLSLAQIGQRAAGHDIFVSLHQNAFNGNAQGHEVFSHPNAPAKDAQLAQAINSELDAIFPDSIIPDRGTKKANFSVLRNAPTAVPAVLVESLFIDAPGMSRGNIETAATAVARGIEKFFTGQATGSTPPPDNSNPPNNSSPLQSGVVNSKVGSLPLNFRDNSYVGASIVGKLSKGTPLKILKSVTGGRYNPGTGDRNDWYQVEVNGQTGYVAGYYVDVTSSNNNQKPLTIKLKPGANNLSFSRGQEWVTSTGYKFRFQHDGNLVLYSPQGKAIWATGTENTGADRLSIQTDGNVVLYDGTKPMWATDTAGNPGAYFAIQGDGNLVVYSSSGKAIFNTGTPGGRQGTLSASAQWLRDRNLKRFPNLKFSTAISKATGKALDSGGSNNSVYPHPSPNSSNNYHSWGFEKVGEHYIIINKATGRALDGGGDGGKLPYTHPDPQKNNPYQLWKIQKVGDAYLIINKATGRALDSGGANGNHIYMHPTPISGNSFHQWKLNLPNSGSSSTDFTGKVMSVVSSLNVRSGPGTGYSKVGSYASNTSLTFDAWTRGTSHWDPMAKQWDNRWFRIKGTNNWVASAYIYGNPNSNSKYIDPPGDSNPGNGSWQNPLAGSWYAIYSDNEFGTPRTISGTHKGIDLSTGNNTPPIKAAKGGKVLMARYGWNDGYGNYVKIDHGNGLETRYAHLSSINVQPGQNVSAGTHIGNVGTTGNSTGNHLHFEIRVNGVPKNPRNYIKF
jgi:N-acetylmuramoyl-L-alanine amidase